DLARRLAGDAAAVPRLARCAFLRPVRPDRPVVVVARRDPARPSAFACEVRVDDTGASRADVRLEPPAPPPRVGGVPRAGGPLPAPATLLRPRPPALRLARLDRLDADAVAARGAAGPWAWSDLLEAAAQTAGLLAGVQGGGPGNRALVAAYHDVVADVSSYGGAIRVHAADARRVLHCWRARAVVA